jgi:hypothetical protein
MYSIEKKLEEASTQSKALSSSASLPALVSLPISPSALPSHNSGQSDGRKRKGKKSFLDWNPEPESQVEVVEANHSSSASYFGAVESFGGTNNNASSIQSRTLESQSITYASPEAKAAAKIDVIKKYQRVVAVIADADFLPPITNEWRRKLVDCVTNTRFFRNRELTDSQKSLMMALLKEVGGEYFDSIRKAILAYDLRSPDIRDHHGIDAVLLKEIISDEVSRLSMGKSSIPQSMPSIKKRRKWLQENLFATEFVLRNLWEVWEDTRSGYGKMILTDLSEHEFRSQLPLPFEKFQNLLEAQVSNRTGSTPSPLLSMHTHQHK